MLVVESVATDNKGAFNFDRVTPGHYTLVAEDQDWGYSDWFDVEITKLPRETASETVDISPHFPNCKGGHELVVRTK